MTYILINTFAGTEISRHRTIEGAAKADIKLNKHVKAANGGNSYIPTALINSRGDNCNHLLIEAIGRISGY